MLTALGCTDMVGGALAFPGHGGGSWINFNQIFKKQGTPIWRLGYLRRRRVTRAACYVISLSSYFFIFWTQFGRLQMVSTLTEGRDPPWWARMRLYVVTMNLGSLDQWVINPHFSKWKCNSLKGMEPYPKSPISPIPTQSLGCSVPSVWNTPSLAASLHHLGLRYQLQSYLLGGVSQG